MPPTLRSATSSPRASTTPSKASKSTSLYDDDNDDDNDTSATPTTTPRKVPHCTKCGRPRRGHPRQICEPDSPQLTANNKDISDALETLHIQRGTPTRGPRNKTTAGQDDPIAPRTTTRGRKSLQPTTPMRDPPAVHFDERDYADRRLRRQSACADLRPSDTLNSLSTTSSELLGTLQFKPGEDGESADDGDDGAEESIPIGANERIIRWQDAILESGPLKSPNSPPTKPKVKKISNPKARMPGTLMTPSPYSSMQSTNPPLSKLEETAPSFQSLTPSSDTSSSYVDVHYYDAGPQTQDSTTANDGSQTPVSSRRAKPLARSMSMEERSVFIKLIHSNQQVAGVYSVPKADIPAIQNAAKAMHYFTWSVDIPVGSVGEAEGEAYLIIGSDELAVRKMKYSFLYDPVGKAKSVRAGGAVAAALTAAAGGALVGAVATFGGLSLS